MRAVVRAERHADAEFEPPLIHRERHHAVNSDGCQHDGDAAEEREHDRDDARFCARKTSAWLCGVPDEVQRQIRIGLRDRLPQRRRERVGRLPPRGFTTTVANWLTNGAGRAGPVGVE